MPEGYEKAARLLPAWLREAAESQSAGVKARAEEFRLRLGREAALLLPEGERSLLPGRVLAGEDLSRVLEAATQSSLHAVRDELRRGYISARGGVRVGVCGTAVMGTGVEGLREFSSLALRIPRQIRDAGGEAARQLSAGDKSVLVLSPPGGGKTTFLRELVRRCGDRGLRVALADERGEVAAVWQGQPQFDVGRCTDVLTGAPKAEAAMMLLRAMNPQVLALDEITAREDVAAIGTVANCGVKLLATAHAASVRELERRPLYRELLDMRVFDLAVVISGREERRYEVVTL